MLFGRGGRAFRRSFDLAGYIRAAWKDQVNV